MSVKSWNEVIEKGILQKYLDYKSDKRGTACECGVDHIGTDRHDKWCPKYRKDQW